jgi:hypothetical protein
MLKMEDKVESGESHVTRMANTFAEELMKLAFPKIKKFYTKKRHIININTQFQSYVFASFY